MDRQKQEDIKEVHKMKILIITGIWLFIEKCIPNQIWAVFWGIAMTIAVISHESH